MLAAIIFKNISVNFIAAIIFRNFFFGFKDHLQWIFRMWNLVTVSNNQVKVKVWWEEILWLEIFPLVDFEESWTSKSNNLTKWTMKVWQYEAYLIDKDELGFIQIKPSDRGFVIWSGRGQEVKLVYNYFQKLRSNFGNLSAKG